MSFSSKFVTGNKQQNMWALIIPLVAFLLIGTLYPEFKQIDPQTSGPQAAASETGPLNTAFDSSETNTYIALIGVQVVVAFGLLVFFRKTYFEQFPVRVHFLAVPVGLLGAVLWIGICALGFEHKLLEPFGLAAYIEVRASFNPFDQIGDESLQIFFLVIRFCLMALLVPIIEELFVRGFLIRYIENPDWWSVSLSSLSIRSAAFASFYGVLAHPGEALAALVWFSLISWLMLRTGNLWDCVLAHSVTNSVLGVYIVTSGAWHLW